MPPKFNYGAEPRRRLPHSAFADAVAAIGELIDHGHEVPDTREQFAQRMGWTRPDGAVDRPDTRRVQDVCALTKDMAGTEEFGGMVITYAPNVGGMVLIDPASPLGDIHLLHLLTGDLTRQQATKTINRRRLPEWKQAGQSFAGAGKLDLARLCWQAEGEISRTGFVESTTSHAIFTTAAAHGYRLS